MFQGPPSQIKQKKDKEWGKKINSSTHTGHISSSRTCYKYRSDKNKLRKLKIKYINLDIFGSIAASRMSALDIREVTSSLGGYVSHPSEENKSILEQNPGNVHSTVRRSHRRPNREDSWATVMLKSRFTIFTGLPRRRERKMVDIHEE